MSTYNVERKIVILKQYIFIGFQNKPNNMLSHCVLAHAVFLRFTCSSSLPLSPYTQITLTHTPQSHMQHFFVR